jgi:hypothetical protein
MGNDFEAFKQSLIAAAYGPFFDDWEFHSLFGLDRAKVKSIADSFSPDTPISGDVALALNNAKGNLFGYPHRQEAIWSKWMSVSPAELQETFSRWRASQP